MSIITFIVQRQVTALLIRVIYDKRLNTISFMVKRQHIKFHQLFFASKSILVYVTIHAIEIKMADNMYIQ